MSVLTADIFADICETLWGKNWKVLAAKRLERSERQLHRLSAGENNVSRRLRLRLLEVVQEQIEVLQAYERDLVD